MPNSYFSWHYLFTPRRLIAIISNYLIFFTYYFSVTLLFKTFFAPFKRQVGVRQKLGLDLNDLATVLTTNLISRSIGVFLRFFTILTWLFIELLVLLSGASLSLLWLLLPGLTLPFYLLWRPKPPLIRRILQKGQNNPVKIFNLLLATPAFKFIQQRLNLNLDDLDRLATNTTWELLTLPSVQNEGGLLFFLAENWPPLETYLDHQNLKAADLLACFVWYQRLALHRRQAAKFWRLDNLLACPAFAQDWTYGYTPALDRFTHDPATTTIERHHLIGRQLVVDQLERVLARTQSRNVILVGEPGVGKQTIILNLAYKIKTGRTPALATTRLLHLNLNQILGQASFPRTLALLENLLQEAARAGNFILVIPHLANFIHLTEPLLKALEKNQVQFIGLATPDEYQKTLLPQTELLKYFEKVEAHAPSLAEALVILEDAIITYEQTTQTLVLYQAIKEALTKANDYLTDTPFPEKALDLLDEACVLAAKNHQTLVTVKDVNQVLSQKTEIPLGEIEKEEINKLNRLEELLHQKIIGQKTAVVALTQTLRRARLGISGRNKPYGSFLFLGPTGVGKTQTAKVLAEAYFGSQDRLIRFDMSEYQGEIGFTKALGNPATQEPGLFIKAIRDNPFSVLLLDEIEKTDPHILNLLLPLLDEGYLTDNFGHRLDCRHLIIIGTSNAASELIRQKVKEKARFNQLNQEILDYVQKERIFSPELLNRFDGVIVYQPLSSNELKQVAGLMLEELNQRLADKEISLKITAGLINQIVKSSNQSEFGARALRRVIQDRLEPQIAQKLLDGSARRGNVLEMEI